MFAAVMFALLPSRVPAATLLVPDQYATIQAAIDAAASGDSVLVGPGTWSATETRTVALCTGDAARRGVVFLKAGVAVIATGGPDVTTIEPVPSLGDITYTVSLAGQDGPPALLRGFTVTGTGVGLVVHCSTSPLAVTDCRIRDNAGAGIRIDSADVTVTDSYVARNKGSKVSIGGIVMDGGTLELFGSTLDENFLTGVHVYRADVVRIEGCELLRHDRLYGSGGRAVDISSCPDVVILDSFFHDNGTAIRTLQASPSIAHSTFARHVDATVVIEGGGAGASAVSGNTFYGTEADIEGSAVLCTEGALTFHGNVVANCAGTALHSYLPPALDASCNVLWGNDDNYGSWQVDGGLPDLLVDPQLCDPDADDFRVGATSPCLPEHRPPGCDGVIGAWGAGCPGDGTVLVGLDTDPGGLQVIADGQTATAPFLVVWTPGESHTIGTPGFQEVGGGVARFFETWSDGGDTTHTITVPSSMTEYVAAFGTSYLLAVAASGGGSVEGGGWRLPGEVAIVVATADPAHQFLRWEGDGSGSYTGTDNPATVTMNGPITQTAIFLPDQYLLTMVAGEGGSVTPESGLRDRASTVEIEAVADSGWVFDHWAAVGDGSYSGPANPVTITMDSAITETAIFQSLTPTLTMIAQPGGTVTPPTGPQLLGSTVTIEAIPDPGYEFGYWFGEGGGSYTGPLNPISITVFGPITQTASFHEGTLPLTMIAHRGGTVTPSSGDYPAFAEVQIVAIPDSGFVFREWIGEGDGSYSGTDQAATITLDGPITQIAEFDLLHPPIDHWIGYEVTLSLSDTDPHVHTGDPVGFGSIYLWLDCATEGGMHSLAADFAGTLEPAAFVPAPGVLSAGGTRHVELAVDCFTGPALLGEFVILPPGEGSFCIEQTADTPPLVVTDCGPTRVYEWPRTVRLTGVRTDGGEPCRAGRGCQDPRGGGIPAGFTTVLAPDGLGIIAPNPFTDTADVHFSLAAQRHVRVTVYDVAGRRVATVLDDVLPAGARVVRWEGRDDAARPVPAGVYFLRLDAGAFHETGKVVRLERR